jgi:hypothetical protein
VASRGIGTVGQRELFSPQRSDRLLDPTSQLCSGSHPGGGGGGCFGGVVGRFGRE